MIESIQSSEDLSEVLARRRKELGLTQEDLEHDVLLTGGHLGKIENAGKTWGKKVFRHDAPVKVSSDGSMTASGRAMTPTLAWVLEALGLELIIVDRETARKLTGPVVAHRQRPHRDKKTKEAHPLAQRLILKMTRRPGT